MHLSLKLRALKLVLGTIGKSICTLGHTVTTCPNPSRETPNNWLRQRIETKT